MPLAGVHNARSMIGVGNLASLLERCAVHADAAGRVFLAADGEDLSTPELIRLLAQGLGCPARLFAFPLGPARAVLGILGGTAVLDRVAGSLRVDAARARRDLSWEPPVRIRDALMEMCAWYRNRGDDPGG